MRGLPQDWEKEGAEFLRTHLNMSFDEPIHIRLRVSPMRGAKMVNYTFLHDWFGDSFTYIGPDKERRLCDIVEVTCSPYAMANFAMQYSDRVEVLGPRRVRDGVMRKLRDMNRKYGLEVGGEEKIK